MALLYWCLDVSRRVSQGALPPALLLPAVLQGNCKVFDPEDDSQYTVAATGDMIGERACIFLESQCKSVTTLNTVQAWVLANPFAFPLYPLAWRCWYTRATHHQIAICLCLPPPPPPPPTHCLVFGSKMIRITYPITPPPRCLLHGRNKKVLHLFKAYYHGIEA